MSFDAIRSAIVTRLGSIPEIGRVHDRERLFPNEQGLRLVYGWPVGGGQQEVRGWFVSLTRWSGSVGRIGRGRRITCEWRICGFRSFVDEASSEIAMAQMVAQIATAFDADPTLGGAALRCAVGDGPDALAGIQCEEIAPVQLAGRVLCHRALLSLPTQHFE